MVRGTLEILLFILLLFFLLVVLRLFAESIQQTEGFENGALPSTLQESYQRFVEFYNPFLVNWEKALTTAVSQEIPVAPQADPANPTPPSPPPPITRIQMNEYVNRLSDKLQKPLPQLTDPLPKEINTASLSMVLSQLPKNTTPYENALQWMNQQMKDAQQNLAGALQGVPPIPAVEGFDANAPTCQEVSQCLANNPEFIAQVTQQVAQEQDAQKKQSAEEQQKELLQRITPFLENASLTQEGATNQELAKQLGGVQQQAESGELYSKINLPDKEPDAPLTIPAGGLVMADMQKTNPQQYNQLKDNYKQWFDVKQLIEQINRNL